MVIIFQSTPSTQRETFFVIRSAVVFEISIHSLYAEGDSHRPRRRRAILISIHSLYAEGDFFPHVKFPADSKFQSTPSTQRETTFKDITPALLQNFNPLPLRRGRRNVTRCWKSFVLFQSTPSTQRETYRRYGSKWQYGRFQSTPSTQRETAKINKILYSNPKNIVENTKLYISNTQQHTCRAHYPLPNYLSASANLPEIPCSLRIRTRTFPRQALLLA